MSEPDQTIIPPTNNPVPGQTGQPSPEDVGATTFAAFAAMCEAGHFNDHATSEYRNMLVELKRHLRDSGGKTAKGKLTLSFDVTLDRDDNVDVLSDVAVKLPKPPKVRTTMWLGKNDTLTQVNPNQKTFSFRMVPVDQPGAGGFKQVTIDQ